MTQAGDQAHSATLELADGVRLELRVLGPNRASLPEPAPLLEVLRLVVQARKRGSQSTRATHHGLVGQVQPRRGHHGLTPGIPVVVAPKTETAPGDHRAQDECRSNSLFNQRVGGVHGPWLGRTARQETAELLPR